MYITCPVCDYRYWPKDVPNELRVRHSGQRPECGIIEVDGAVVHTCAALRTADDHPAATPAAGRPPERGRDDGRVLHLT